MPGKTASQKTDFRKAAFPMEGIVPRMIPEGHVTEIVEVFRKVDRGESGSSDAVSAEVRVTVGMTSDNYYG